MIEAELEARVHDPAALERGSRRGPDYLACWARLGANDHTASQPTRAQTFRPTADSQPEPHHCLHAAA